MPGSFGAAAFAAATVMFAGAAQAQGDAQRAGIAPPAGFAQGSVAHLAALCTATPDNPDQAEARGLCRGFLIGVGQYHAALHPVGAGPPPVFCLPDPRPTLAQISAGFAAWASANQQYAAERAVDGVVRWARATYPCAAAPTPRRGQSR